MSRGRLGAIATMLALVVGCGGDDPSAPDAAIDSGGDPADAGAPDATPGACFADLIDLDDPSVGQHMGNSVYFIGTVRGGDGEMDPLAGCTTGGTRNEKVHKITTTARSRVRATTIDQNTQNLNTVVYIRTECLDQDSELACNDDAGGQQSFVAANDVPAGTTVYVVVDAAQTQSAPLPQMYGLTVVMDDVVTKGGSCDPQQIDNVCEAGTVCSVAGGAPVCAPSLGGPTLTVATMGVLQNSSGIGFNVQGTDPDGDVLAVFMTFLDDTGAAIDITGDGVPDNRFNFTQFLTGPLAGQIDFDVNGQVGGFFGGGAASVRVEVVDSSGTFSSAIETPIHDPTWVGLGDACDGGALDCWGELECEAMICEQPADGAATCAAAEASTAITTSGVVTVNIAAGAPDTLEGSCFYSRGLGETVLKVQNTAAGFVRVRARTDAPPSVGELDTYVYIRTSCVDAASEIGCNDDINPGGGDFRSNASGVLEPGQTGYVVVDGSFEGQGFVASGTIGVDVTFTTLLNPGATCTPADECVPGFVCYDVSGSGTTTCTDAAAVYASLCAEGDVLVDGMTYSGSLPVTGTSFWEASCRYSGPYPEDFHTLTLTGKADVTLSTGGAGTLVDTVIAVLDACAPTAAEVGCNDDISLSTPDYRSSLEVTLEAGTYTVVVDTSSQTLPDGSGASADPGVYALQVTVFPVIAAGQPCDATGATNRCDDGLTCTGTPATCQ